MKFLLTVVVFCLLTGCADNVSFADAEALSKVGFWYGLWHGIIAPFAFIISLFSDNVSIYAIYNNGGWYNFGYLIGIGSLGVLEKLNASKYLRLRVSI